MDLDIPILNNNDFQITQFYGENPTIYQKWGLPFHIGVDIVCPNGDWTINAFKNGEVKYAGWKNGGYGNVVIILQDDNVLVKYMHLEGIFVVPNQKVLAGQDIGVIGNTGNSTGRHLHFECTKWDGNIWSINGHFDPLPYLKGLTSSQPSISSPAIIEVKTNNNEDDMPKIDLINAINNKFTEPEKTNLANAVHNNDWNYLLAFSGSEIRADIQRKQIDLDTINAKYHVLLEERNQLFDENANLKKKSEELKANQSQVVEQNQALQEPQIVQNQSQVEAKTNEIQALSNDLKTAEANSKRSLLKENKGKAITGGGILGALGLSYLEPYLNQIGNLKPIFTNIIESLRWWHLGVAVVLLGIAFMYRSKIQAEIQKALNNN